MGSGTEGEAGENSVDAHAPVSESYLGGIALCSWALRVIGYLSHAACSASIAT